VKAFQPSSTALRTCSLLLTGVSAMLWGNADLGGK
jgi:hypothetical protein